MRQADRDLHYGDIEGKLYSTQNPPSYLFSDDPDFFTANWRFTTSSKSMIDLKTIEERYKSILNKAFPCYNFDVFVIDYADFELAC